MAERGVHAQADEDRDVGDGFWDQWSTTSLADITRDTYGPEKRRILERELGADSD